MQLVDDVALEWFAANLFVGADFLAVSLVAAVGDVFGFATATVTSRADHLVRMSCCRQAFPADDEPAEQVGLLGGLAATGVWVVADLLLDSCEFFGRDDCGDTSGELDNLGLGFAFATASTARLLNRAVEGIDAGIFLVAQDGTEAVLGEWLAFLRNHPSEVQFADNLVVAETTQVEVEDEADGFGFGGVEDVLASDGVDIVAERWEPSGVLPLHRCLAHPFHDFAGEVLGIVGGHALEHGFEDEALGRIVEVLEHGDKANAVGLEDAFVVREVVFIAAEAVEFVDDMVVGGVGDEALEFGSFVGGR